MRERSSVSTERGGVANPDFRQLLAHLDLCKEVGFLLMENTEGVVLRLAFSGTSGTPASLRFHVRNLDGTQRCTQRINNELKILQTLQQFYETGVLSESFRWLPTTGFQFDYEKPSPIAYVPSQAEAATNSVPGLPSKSPQFTHTKTSGVSRGAKILGGVVVLACTAWFLHIVVRQTQFQNRRAAKTDASEHSVIAVAGLPVAVAQTNSVQSGHNSTGENFVRPTQSSIGSMVIPGTSAIVDEKKSILSIQTNSGHASGADSTPDNITSNLPRASIAPRAEIDEYRSVLGRVEIGTALFDTHTHRPFGFIVDIEWGYVWVADTYSIGERDVRLFAHRYQRSFITKNYVTK